MKYFKLWIGIIIVLSITGTAFSEEKRKKMIGFIPMTMSNEYFVIMVNAARSEAEKQNAELFVHPDMSMKHRSQFKQIEIIEDMLAKKVDAICIVPSSGGVVRALKKVQQANIPIINIDTKIDQEVINRLGLTAIPYVGTNNYEGAKMGGGYAISNLDITGKEVAVLIGISHQKNAQDRWNGFRDAVSGKVAIVSERPANWETDLAYSVFKTILPKRPALDFVFASNDNMALGAVKAIREAGRKNIKIMGYDGITEALHAIEARTMVATVAQLPAEMGIKGVQMALEMLKGNPVPEIIYTETKVIDSSNVSEFKSYLKKYK